MVVGGGPGGAGGMGSEDTTDGRGIRMFKCHNLAVLRESVQEIWIAPVFSTVVPRVKCERLLAFRSQRRPRS